MHHASLNRPRPNDGHLDHQIVEASRSESGQHAHLCATLNLENAHRVCLADHVVRGRVFGGDVLHAEHAALALPDEVQRLAYRSQHAQRQTVDLEQAERIQVILVPFDHGAIWHRGVLDWHHAAQRSLGEHEAAGVLAQVPRKTNELARQMHQLLNLQRIQREAAFPQPLGVNLGAIPPLMPLGQRVHCLQ